MTSIALAHGAAPAFNADFYTVAATVIPVLFLALAVQGSVYGDLLKTFARGMREMFSANDQAQTPARTLRVVVRRAVPGFVTVIPMMLATLIILFGIFGEILALLALYSRRPLRGIRILPTILPAVPPDLPVLLAVITLTVIAGAVPALALCKSWIAVYRETVAGPAAPNQQDSSASTSESIAAPPPESEVDSAGPVSLQPSKKNTQPLPCAARDSNPRPARSKRAAAIR